MVTFIKSTYASKNAPASHAWVGYIFKEILVPVTPATEDQPASEETKIGHTLIPITFHGISEEAIVKKMDEFIIREDLVNKHTFYENERKKAAREAAKEAANEKSSALKSADVTASGEKIDRRRNPSPETLAKRAAGRAKYFADRRAKKGGKSASSNG